jgi:hypothetical protein
VDFIQWCKEDGVQVLTAYAFSTENWSRDPVEVQTLMAIFAQYAERLRTEALTHNVKVNILSTGKWLGGGVYWGTACNQRYRVCTVQIPPSYRRTCGGP